MGLSFLRKSYLLKLLGLSFSSKLDWGSFIISIAKTASKKIEVLLSFFLLRLLSVSLNLPYGLARNTFVMFGLLLVAAARKC